MLFARRAQGTRQRIASLFGLIDGATHDLSFLPPDQEKLYRDACAVLTKQSIDGHTLTHVATSVAPFIGYRHHHRGAPTGPATGGGEGGSAPADSNSDAVVHHEEGEGKGKGKEKNRLEPAADGEASAASKEDLQDQVLFEAKLYVLCLIAIAQNQSVCDELLRLASSIQHHHREWSLREDQPFWYLYEKTPWYWLNYLLLKRDETPHPITELREKLRHLRALEKNTFAFIGVGSRILSRYEAVGRTNYAERLSNLIRKDQLLFQHFFTIPERDQAHKATEAQKHKSGAGDRLRFHMLRTLSRSREHRIEEEEEEDEEKEDVLYNLAQTVNLTYFDYHSADVIGETTTETTPNIPNLYAQLMENVKKAALFPTQMKHTLNEYKRPSALSTNWLKYSCITAGIAVGVLSVVKRREDIIDWLVDFKVLAKNFIQKNILLPLQDVYETIRYEKRAFTIMDARALDADVESLQRMVDEYVRKLHPHISQAQLEEITAAAANSDISAIMPVYERELESPIKNALFGDLLSLLLIQVHKAKVDVARAMLALDKLMRANELNFQLFAVTPAILLVGGLSRYLYRRITRIDIRRTTHVQIRQTLRNVERMLDLNLSSAPASASSSVRHHAGGPTSLSLSTSFSGWGRSSTNSLATHGRPESDLRLEDTGRLLVAINELIRLALQMPRDDRKWLLEDLQDLQAEELQVAQKLATIHRMYHTHHFLSAV